MFNGLNAMSKKPAPSPKTPAPAIDRDRLVVRGVRRKEPDWDTFVAALLSYALRQVEDDDPGEVEPQ